MIPLRSHYRLSDLVLASSTKELEDRVTRGRADMPEWVEVQKHHMESLEHAESSLPFHRLAMSVQMESALSEHEGKPFVHVFTSLPDQGVGPLDLLYARKDVLQEVLYSWDRVRGTALKKVEHDIDASIKDIEASGSMEDGTIQVQLGEFFKDEDYGATVSEAKEFSLFMPSLRKSGFKDKDFPADTAIHFQVHSTIENSEGNASHQLTGTGFLHLSKLVSEVMSHAEHTKTPHEDDENAHMVSVQIPLKLNSISSQNPDAKTVYRVARGKDLQSENEKLYQGSLFLYVDLSDKDTQDFFHQFGRGMGFSEPSIDDVTEGNFAHIATSMRFHTIRDMAPFIPQFTEAIPISIEEERGIGDKEGRVVSGWTFEPSLPEGKGIHAPYNKGNKHTLPGFTYFSDRAMQRLPNTEFILHVAHTVLDRWDMDERDFIRFAHNPVLQNKVSGKMKFAPEYIDVLAITSEMLTAYPTAMNYRGDYADMNTSILKKMRTHSNYLSNHETIHHLEHGTGMTRVPAISPHSQKWDPRKKIGTEMFGDAVIDKSGDCEDFAKLIDRMVVGIKACSSRHPLVASLQTVLENYEAYSVLSSVTSRNIREAPSTSKAKEEEIEVALSGVDVGSPEDLKAGIGAHMWTILLPSSMVEKAFKATHRREEIAADTMPMVSGKTGEQDRERLAFIQGNLPPLVLEGTGPALSLLLAKEHYHSTMPDKITAINSDLARLEALSRLMTGLPSDQITQQSMREAGAIFASFTLPIQTNKIIDLNVNERPSPFYRMAVEMFSIRNNERITPSTLVQLSEQKHRPNPFPLSPPAEENRFWRARTLPVQLGLRSGATGKDEPSIGYPYGINLTDLVHRREELFGMLETIQSSEEEQRIIDNVMRHTPSSPVICVAPIGERKEAQSMAQRFRGLLNFEGSKKDGLDRTISRGYMGRPQDLHIISMSVRTDNVTEESIRRLADHLADNGFVGQEPVRVTAESFSRGHHLIRIAIPVDVTGVKQLYFESDALAERLNVPADRLGPQEEQAAQKVILVKELKKLLS